MKRRARKDITSAGMSTFNVSQQADKTTLHTLVTDGPADSAGRYVYTQLKDAEVMHLLAGLAAQPRWAVAIAAIYDDPTFQDAAQRNTYYMAGGERRRVLIALMRAAMARYDADQHDELNQLRREAGPR